MRIIPRATLCVFLLTAGSLLAFDRPALIIRMEYWPADPTSLPWRGEIDSFGYSDLLYPKHGWKPGDKVTWTPAGRARTITVLSSDIAGLLAQAGFCEMDSSYPSGHSKHNDARHPSGQEDTFILEAHNLGCSHRVRFNAPRQIAGVLPPHSDDSSLYLEHPDRDAAQRFLFLFEGLLEVMLPPELLKAPVPENLSRHG